LRGHFNRNPWEFSSISSHIPRDFSFEKRIGCQWICTDYTADADRISCIVGKSLNPFLFRIGSSLAGGVEFNQACFDRLEESYFALGSKGLFARDRNGEGLR